MKKLLTVLSVILLLAGVTGTSYAQGIGFHGIGGRVGFAKPENIDGTFSIGAHANLGEVIENLVIFPSVDYWGKSELGLDFSQFAINADGRYYFPSSGSMSFFGGAGLGFIFTHAEVSFLGQSAGDTNMDIGLNLFGGLDVPVGEKLSFTAETRFVVSDISTFKVLAGVTYRMGE